MIIKQFEVWIADLNPAGGTVPGKIRPVIIVQTEGLNKIQHPSTIILPVTTNVFANVSLLRINLTPNNTNGLLEKSAILLDQIRAIDNKKFLKKIGFLDSSETLKIKELLKIILDI